MSIFVGQKTSRSAADQRSIVPLLQSTTRNRWGKKDVINQTIAVVMPHSTIVNPTVNKLSYAYNIYAHSSGWNSSLKIMGAVITYTIDEAP